MKMRAFFILNLMLVVLGLCACRNQYEVPSYVITDSYTSVFEGKKVPQDMR